MLFSYSWILLCKFLKIQLLYPYVTSCLIKVVYFCNPRLCDTLPVRQSQHLKNLLEFMIRLCLCKEQSKTNLQTNTFFICHYTDVRLLISECCCDCCPYYEYYKLCGSNDCCCRSLFRLCSHILSKFPFYKDEWSRLSLADYQGYHTEHPANTWFVVFRYG